MIQSQVCSPLKSNLGPLRHFWNAATAKLIASIVTYPHEVLRTRMREATTVGNDAHYKYISLHQSIKTIWKEEGFLAFYGGMPAHLIRVVPNSAIMFFCYELMVQILH
jgi:solute carrier family 25 protein 33/36